MDICEAFRIWDELGNTTDSHTDQDNNYVIEFINKSGEVVGNIITYPGQGIKIGRASIVNVIKISAI